MSNVLRDLFPLHFKGKGIRTPRTKGTSIQSMLLLDKSLDLCVSLTMGQIETDFRKQNGPNCPL